MSRIWSVLKKNATITASVYNVTRTYDPSSGGTTDNRTLSGTISAIEWETTGSNSNIAEKLRDKVDKVLAVSPTETVYSSDEIEINSTNYGVVHVDNVATQGQVKIIYLEQRA